MNFRSFSSVVRFTSPGWLKTFFKMIIAGGVTFLFSFALSLSAKAQSDTEFVITPREHQEFLRKAREGELESTGPAKERQRLKLVQIREDFRRIQAINNDTIRRAISTGDLKLGKISKASEEIERRAGRLKTNLALPEGEVPTEQTSRAYLEQMKQLDASIWSFVSNPIFKTTEVLDVQLAEKASRDLQAIINLSHWLKTKRE